MAKKVKELGTPKKPIKTSMLGAISIWWGLIICCIAPLAVGVLMLTRMIDLNEILAGMDFISVDIKDMLTTVIPFVFVGIGAIVFVLLVRKAYKASRAKYVISECMLLQRKGKKDLCKLIFKPGMSVSIPKRTIKEKLLSYGDVVIFLGPGEGGEVRLHNVKNPKKVKAKLDEIIKDNCMSFARTMVFNV